MFGSGNDLHSQYGGLFYSNAASSSMVGPPHSSSPSLSQRSHSLRTAPAKKQLQQAYPFTAPTTPSTAISFNLKGQEDGMHSGDAAFFSSFPSEHAQKETQSIDPRDLLACPSPPFSSPPSSHSISDENDTFSSFSSHTSSPAMRATKLFDHRTPSSELNTQHETRPKQPSTNRFFGSHQSQVMHEDSDSPFTTDFSSSEDETSFR